MGSWIKISFDEATRGFKGKYILKSVIKYKSEGDDYLLDCLGYGGFIYTFFLRTPPAPKKWVDKGLCPAQSRVLFLFEQLPCKFHTCSLDNFFMYTNICRTIYVELNSNIKKHGVTR